MHAFIDAAKKRPVALLITVAEGNRDFPAGKYSGRKIRA